MHWPPPTAYRAGKTMALNALLADVAKATLYAVWTASVANVAWGDRYHRRRRAGHSPDSGT
jgi:hypothetical protein